MSAAASVRHCFAPFAKLLRDYTAKQSGRIRQRADDRQQLYTYVALPVRVLAERWGELLRCTPRIHAEADGFQT